MTKYTADDFTNARFATHPDGRIAARIGRDLPWVMPCVENCESVGLECDGLDNAPSTFMSKEGWVPVQDPEVRGNALAADLAAAVVRADTAEADLADFQAMHARQIETIARLQKTARPLTADDITDEMIRRARTAWLEFARTDGTPTPEVTREMLSAALTEPPARPEGAEEIERLLTEGLGDFSPPATPEAVADLLAVRGIRVTGDQS